MRNQLTSIMAIAVSLIALAYALLPSADNDSDLPTIDSVQDLVNESLGRDYEVSGVVKDGSLFLLSIKYRGYSINNIYLREDKKRLIRSELVQSPKQAQLLASAKYSKDKTEYRNSIQKALSNEVSHLPETPLAKLNDVKNENRSEHKYITPPDLPRRTEVPDLTLLYKDLELSRYVSEREGTRVLYVFHDYRCPACKDAEAYLRSLSSDKNIEVRYVPVGALGPDSLALGAYVVDSGSMDERIHRSRRVRDEPLRVLDDINSKVVSLGKPTVLDVIKSFQLLKISDRGGTPTFVYLTKDGVRASTVGSTKKLGLIIDSIIPNSR